MSEQNIEPVTHLNDNIKYVLERLNFLIRDPQENTEFGTPAIIADKFLLEPSSLDENLIKFEAYKQQYVAKHSKGLLYKYSIKAIIGIKSDDGFFVHSQEDLDCLDVSAYASHLGYDLLAENVSYEELETLVALLRFELNSKAEQMAIGYQTKTNKVLTFKGPPVFCDQTKTALQQIISVLFKRQEINSDRFSVENYSLNSSFSTALLLLLEACFILTRFKNVSCFLLEVTRSSSFRALRR